jgi:hypothetical protein
LRIGDVDESEKMLPPELKTQIQNFTEEKQTDKVHHQRKSLFATPYASD